MPTALIADDERLMREQLRSPLRVITSATPVPAWNRMPAASLPYSATAAKPAATC
jgi:hypothetical protein